jgi:hypothetical protein
MTEAAKTGRPARRTAAPEISLVRKEEPPPAAAGKPKPAPSEGVAPLTDTTEDPWRHLHPSRVWPD